MCTTIIQIAVWLLSLAGAIMVATSVGISHSARTDTKKSPTKILKVHCIIYAEKYMSMTSSNVINFQVHIMLFVLNVSSIDPSVGHIWIWFGECYELSNIFTCSIILYLFTLICINLLNHHLSLHNISSHPYGFMLCVSICIDI